MPIPTVPSLNTTSAPLARAAPRKAAASSPAAIEEDTGIAYILGYEDCRKVLNDRA